MTKAIQTHADIDVKQMCQPLSAYWESYAFNYDQPFTCINGNVLSPLVGVLSVVSDIYAVVLPCVWLHRYNLNVTRRQRIGLDVVFALGTMYETSFE